MEVIYNNKNIMKGEILTIKETQLEPEVYVRENNNTEITNNYYILLVRDPNSVSGNYIHWLITNIKDINNLKNGKTYFKYKGPSPPSNTGKHHYIFEIYKTNKTKEKMNNENRNISYELLKKELKITSNPIVSTYFIIDSNKNNNRSRGGKRRKNRLNKYRKITRKISNKKKE
jgi:phosphatidylethanolamine-binding protein (PEBP) family uncharacterized protein